MCSAGGSGRSAATSARHSGGGSTRRGTRPSARASPSTSVSSPLDSASAHRLAAEVTRSAASTTSRARIHSARADVSCCIASVRGARRRIAAIATVLSVNEYTDVRAAIGCSATRPSVDAASSRSQMSSWLSCSLHSPHVYNSSAPATHQAPKPAFGHARAASA